MQPLGSRGIRKDLLIVLGATYGPYPVSFTGLGGTPIDVTGCTLHAQVRRDPTTAGVDDPLLTFDCPLVNVQGLPQFTIGLTAAASADVPTGKNLRDPLSHAWWSMVLRDSAQRVLPIAWGTAALVRDAAHVV